MWCLQGEIADWSSAGPLGLLSGKPEVRRPFWEHSLCQEPSSTTTVRGVGVGGASLSQWFAEAPLSVAEGWKPLLADDGDWSSHSDPCWDGPSSFYSLVLPSYHAGDLSRALVLGGFSFLFVLSPCISLAHLRATYAFK